MNGTYDFLFDLKRLRIAYNRFETFLWLLNAAILSLAIYNLALLLGIPAFFRFYWQDMFFLAEAPFMISIIIGIGAAILLQRRKKSDFFQRFDPQLSEQAKAAYDNRETDSVIMQSLAADVKRSLSIVSNSDIVDWHQLKVRLAVFLLLAVGTILISYGQVGAEISPTDFEALLDIKERAQDIFLGETPTDERTMDSGLQGEIYGKPSLAVLEEVNLELMLYPGAGAGYRSIETEPGNHLFRTSAPVEGAAVSSELYIESLPPQHRDIIKRYFETLAKD